MTQPIVHIINHTHWDREWFLSSIYTTHWIPTLIDKLLEISAENPDFRYLLDGQTLIIEDLLKAYPNYEPKVAKLIRDGNLTIGPYYCQPDWKLTHGESLFRNLEFGRKDMEKFGRTTHIGWLVDTFGHISQSPQIHDQAGIDAVYVWRGMPLLVPYFNWEGADGTEIFGVDLFGGYRNLYGMTHAPDVALRRLQLQIDNLAPYYPTPDIPLFDGYDLEDNPEDSVTFLKSKVVQEYSDAVENTPQLLEATPRSFVEAVRPKLNDIPTISGELNSGKYGAIFTGVYSSRTYSKIMARDCANMLYRWAEPLAVMAWQKGRPYEADKYEAWSRLLLQNDVHDVICGVSIDQVHEKAEDICKTIFEEVRADIEHSLHYVLSDFAAGTYAVTATPNYSDEAWPQIGTQMYWAALHGLGVAPTSPPSTHEARGSAPNSSSFSNDFYDAVTIEADGIVQFGEGRLGYLMLSPDYGDTYSDETDKPISILQPSSQPRQVSRGAGASICYRCETTVGDTIISADVEIFFDTEPLIRWEITLDSQGNNFRIDFVFDTLLNGQIQAGMPFDVVKRPFADSDLLPREVGDKAKIFMGQRELNEVRSFPFHDFVAIDDGEQSAVIFAKGLNSYRAYEDGKIAVTLRRSGEWVTRGNLENRIGDAGPFFYVPDARCERKVTHELAFAMGEFSADSAHVQRLNAAYQNPPLIVEWNGEGTETEWQFLQSDAPISSLRLVDGQPVARFFNPTNEPLGGIPPKKVVSKPITVEPATPQLRNSATSQLRILNYPKWRVGKNHGLPSEVEIGRLHDKIAASRAAKEQAESELAGVTGNERHLIQHRVYIHHREMLEYKLSARLNEIKLALNGEVDHNYLYEPDPQIVQIGWKLNQLRIKRRIYDYVAAALA